MRAKSGEIYLKEACEHYGLPEEEIFRTLDEVEKQAGDMAYKVRMLRELYQGSNTKALAAKYGYTVRKVYSIVTDARFKMGGYIYRQRGAQKQANFERKVQEASSVADLAAASGVNVLVVKFILEHPELSNARLEQHADSIELVRQFLCGTSVPTIAEENALAATELRKTLQQTMIIVAREAPNVVWQCNSWSKEVQGNSPSSIAAAYGIDITQYEAAVDKLFENTWLAERGKKVYTCWSKQETATKAAVTCLVSVSELTSRLRLVLRNLTMSITQMYPQAVATAMEMSGDQAAQRSTQSDKTVFS